MNNFQKVITSCHSQQGSCSELSFFFFFKSFFYSTFALGKNLLLAVSSSPGPFTFYAFSDRLKLWHPYYRNFKLNTAPGQRFRWMQGLSKVPGLENLYLQIRSLAEWDAFRGTVTLTAVHFPHSLGKPQLRAPQPPFPSEQLVCMEYSLTGVSHSCRCGGGGLWPGPVLSASVQEGCCLPPRGPRNARTLCSDHVYPLFTTKEGPPWQLSW